MTMSFDLGIAPSSKRQKKNWQMTHPDNGMGNGDTLFETPDSETPFIAIPEDIWFRGGQKVENGDHTIKFIMIVAVCDWATDHELC